MGETLAHAALLNEGYGVRFSGQDSGRGTLHRHAVLHDQNRENGIPERGFRCAARRLRQPDFEMIDSVLSEEAVLGFEYVSTSEPNQLVVWEAQLGDFANGAQVVIDQSVAAGEVKWARLRPTLLYRTAMRGRGRALGAPRAPLQLCAEYNAGFACRRRRRRSSICCGGRWCATSASP
jgi:2-oxoglutarate dehydrogenase E1 component